MACHFRNDGDDEYYEEIIPERLAPPSSTSLQQDGTKDHPRAVLWVPDPEQHHGWREFYVYPETPRQKPGLGYKPRRKP